MIIQEHINLYKRNIAAILIIGLLTAATTAILGYQKFEQSFNSTLFLSISVDNNKSPLDKSTSYDDVQAADQFTETIQGWFKNPKFIEKIKNKAGKNVSLSANKQEKQNLVITFPSEQEILGEKTAKAIEQVLIAEMEIFNSRTTTDFQIALSNLDTREQSSKLPLLIVFGIILGLCLGIGLSYLYEFLFGFASYKYQIENLLNKKADETLSSSNLKKGDLHYINALMTKISGKSFLLTSVSFSPSKIKTALSKNNNFTFNIAAFPADAEKLVNLEKENLVILCKLGTSKLNQIEKILALLPEKYLLIILE